MPQRQAGARGHRDPCAGRPKLAAEIDLGQLPLPRRGRGNGGGVGGYQDGPGEGPYLSVQTGAQPELPGGEELRLSCFCVLEWMCTEPLEMLGLRPDSLGLLESKDQWEPSFQWCVLIFHSAAATKSATKSWPGLAVCAFPAGGTGSSLELAPSYLASITCFPPPPTPTIPSSLSAELLFLVTSGALGKPVKGFWGGFW